MSVKLRGKNKIAQYLIQIILIGALKLDPDFSLSGWVPTKQSYLSMNTEHKMVDIRNHDPIGTRSTSDWTVFHNSKKLIYGPNEEVIYT